MTTHTQSEDKLRELILLIAAVSERDESFGAIKLNKLLFNADFNAYLKWGKSISGQPYFALENGPAPKAMKPLTKEMVKKQELVILKREYYGEIQHKPIALRSANLGVFSRDELHLVHSIVAHYVGKSAKEMSEESHEFLGWLAARPQEEIPYEVALVGTRGPTLNEIARGLELESMAQECLVHNASRKAKDDNRRG